MEGSGQKDCSESCQNHGIQRIGLVSLAQGLREMPNLERLRNGHMQIRLSVKQPAGQLLGVAPRCFHHTGERDTWKLLAGPL